MGVGDDGLSLGDLGPRAVSSPGPGRPRYRFGPFVVSPARRQLLCDGEEIPLVPRYFDLLLLLLRRRAEAVSRRDILDSVWGDVIVTDGSVSQGVRILRRALGDDSREPRFIRTLSRHGYRFIHPDVVEEDDAAPFSSRESARTAADAAAAPSDAYEPLLRRLTGQARFPIEEADELDLLEAAEQLHRLGTDETLRRLGDGPGAPVARAFLREARWGIAGAGPVPILGRPDAAATLRVLFSVRWRRAVRLAGRRWAAAMTGGTIAGAIGGLGGAIALHAGPGSRATGEILPALTLVGAAIGGIGAAGVGAGLALAEVLVRSFRRTALVLLGAAGGLTVAAITHAIAAVGFHSLFGRDLAPVAGGLEGLVIGASTGLGYGLGSFLPQGGMATPHGWRRAGTVALTAAACAAGCVALTLRGSYLGAMSLDLISRSFPGSQVSLDPLAHLLSEPVPGTLTRAAVACWEGLLFGGGLALGLTRRKVV